MGRAAAGDARGAVWVVPAAGPVLSCPPRTSFLNAPALFSPEALTPTDEQLAIQTASDRTIIVQANAGAAKTTTLALRMGEALARGTAPERILTLTYTEPACDALWQALAKVGVPVEAAARLRVCTFEQFAEGVLFSVERRRIQRRVTPEALAPTVWQAIHRLDVGVDSGIVERFLNVARRLKGSLRHEQLLWDGQRISAEVAEDIGTEHLLLRLFAAFEDIRYARGDHCDWPAFRGEFDATYDLARLLADPESATPVGEIGAWPLRLEEVLVDEMHDLNLAMFTIVKALLQTQPARFCGVGDFDQVVHETAGAEQRFMAADVDFGPGRRVRLYPLTATRRFGPSLAAMAGRLTHKKYSSDSARKTRVDCRFYVDGDGEAEVVAEAQKWQASHANDMTGFVVLLRHPYQSVQIENALLKAGLTYRTLGFGSYLMQPEVLLIRALLALATNDHAQLESEATRRALVRAVVFFCGVHLEYRDSQGESAEERLEDAIKAVAADAAALKPFLEFQVLRRGEPAMVRRLEAALEACKLPGPGMLENCLAALDMGQLVQTVFVEKQRRADALAYMKGMTRAAQSFATAQAFLTSLNQSENLLKQTASVRTTRQKATVLKKKSLVLALVSSVKGLEFDQVVMPYLSQGEFPARLSTSAVEERNLFYVGMTRARQGLTLLVDQARPSELIAMAGAAPTGP